MSYLVLLCWCPVGMWTLAYLWGRGEMLCVWIILFRPNVHRRELCVKSIVEAVFWLVSQRLWGDNTHWWLTQHLQSKQSSGCVSFDFANKVWGGPIRLSPLKCQLSPDRYSCSVYQWTASYLCCTAVVMGLIQELKTQELLNVQSLWQMDWRISWHHWSMAAQYCKSHCNM